MLKFFNVKTKQNIQKLKLEDILTAVQTCIQPDSLHSIRKTFSILNVKQQLCRILNKSRVHIETYMH
jgi:hypothetical protein